MLRITRQTDYGIVLMTQFLEGGDKKVLSARDMAEQTKLPLPTVSKILKALTRADVLSSTRGVHGGYSLSRDPHSITITDIIEALEGPISITECADGQPRDCLIAGHCPCEDNWSRINTAIRGALADVRLSEMNGGCKIPFSGLPGSAETITGTGESEGAASDGAEDSPA